MSPLIVSLFTSFLLLSRVHAWLASEYIEISAIVDGSGETLTSTGYLTPTAAVTPYSTSTDTAFIAGEQMTVLQLLLSGTNLPTASPTLSTPVAGNFTSINWWAPATITAPPSCTQTSFSFVTVATVNPPDLMLQSPNFPLITSSDASMTTTYYANADGQTTSTSSWSAIDYYLQTGQVLPPIEPEVSAMLYLCQDPRGCYSGVGDGCTAAASATATEVNGPPATVTEKTTAAGKSTPTSSGTTSATASATKNAAGRIAPAGGDGWWVCAAMGVAGLFGAMMVL